MKYLKIFLAIVVLGTISIFIWKWSTSIGKVTPSPPPKNLFTEKIETEIDSLKKMPTDVFCHDFYKNIQDGINEFYKNGDLGNSKKHNKQWYENLSKNLYAAYASKFIDQAMIVFNGSDWKIDDLNFIRSEVKILKQSTYLTSTSYFGTIDEILSKYDEITSFIANCNNFYYSDNSINADFPDLSNLVLKSNAYLSNNLDNSYVNNCASLKPDLEAIPRTLFNKHVSYLKDKIGSDDARYCKHDYHSEFTQKIYNPLSNQLKALKNETYNIEENYFLSQYNVLDNKLSTHNTSAFKHFRNSNKVKCN
jgi:hypothetical protein